jgi:hypothetical protein
LSGATPKTCAGFNLIWHAGMTIYTAVPPQMAESSFNSSA